VSRDRGFNGIEIAAADAVDIGTAATSLRRRLCKIGSGGKACSKHRRSQYANHLKWPFGPPQTSPHAHPRLRRVALYATHTHTYVATTTRLLTLFRDLAQTLSSLRPVRTSELFGRDRVLEMMQV
jgi:hypothetical protein